MADFDASPQHMSEDIREIKTTLNTLADQFNRFCVDYTREHERVVNVAEKALERTQSNANRIDNLDSEIKNFSKTIQPLVHEMKVVKWIGGIIGTAIIGLVIAVVTGQVQLIFP